MNKKLMYKRTLILTIIIFLIGVSISPIISGISFKKNIMSTVGQDNISMTFYSFEKKGINENSISLETNKAHEIIEMLEELSSNIIKEPYSDETSMLKSDFIDLVDVNGLIPDNLEKKDVVSLLDPAWFGILKNNPGLRSRDLFSNGFSEVFSRVGFLSRLLLDSDLIDLFDDLSGPLGFSGALFFCNLASGGHGFPIPLFLLPRPRALMLWLGSDYCFSNVGSLISGRSFIAGGSQTGISVGFIGVGLTYSLLGVTYYGLIGYSLFTFVNAIAGEWYSPPNNKPVISNENPSDGAVNVPVSLSELSFQISDADRDRMSYSVNTNPNIGSGTGNWKKNGFYSVPVSNLKENQEYSWKVTVNDQYESVEKTFTFKTEPIAPIVSDTLPVDGDDWVPVDVSELSFRLSDFQGDLMDYTVETSPDIGSGSGSGVDDGTYKVSVIGLDDTTEYSWFVNVTDGTYWTRDVFVFKTQPLMVFDPFDEGWSYRKKVTVDHDLVYGDLSDFPVLVSIEDMDLRDKAQVDGGDILFMDGSGVANRLFHEIELFDNSDGKLITWINLEELDGDDYTVFYLYYGNPSCNSQEYSDFVWDSNYVAVWHMDGNDYSEFEDSTVNGFDATSDIGGPTYKQLSKIGYCVRFDGIDDQILICDDDKFSFCDASGDKPCSFEAWVKTDKAYGTIVTKFDDGDTGEWIFYIDQKDKCHIYLRDSVGSSSMSRITSSEVTDNNWLYLASTFDGGTDYNKIICYLNGADNSEWGERGPNYVHMRNKGDIVRIGRYNADSHFDGYIDEIRISKNKRQPEWIKTSFNSINYPLEFLEFGPEEKIP